MRQLGGGEPPVARRGRLRLAVGAVGRAEFVVVVLPAQGVVDAAGLGRMAAHDGEVGLVHPLRFELRAEPAPDLAVEGEEQHAGRAAVEAMHRMHVLPDLVAQQLHGEASFVAVEQRAVHEQARRFVDGDQILVAIDDRERRMGIGVAQAAVSGGASGNSPST